MPEENPLIEILGKVTREQDQKARIHREHLNHLKDIFRQNRNSLTDAELLDIILEAGTLLDRPESNQEDDIDPYMNSLTFTTDSLVDDDEESLKRAWSEFLGKTLVDMKTRTGDRYEGVALWYFNKEMWSHSVAVYESSSPESNATGRLLPVCQSPTPDSPTLTAKKSAGAWLPAHP